MRTNGLDRLHGLWNERFGRRVPEKIVCVGLNYRDHAAGCSRERTRWRTRSSE